MKRMLIILSALLLFRPAYDVSVFHSFSFGSRVAGREGQTLVMFWNLENLFDWRRDSLNLSESEAEFTSFGKKHWTKRRFIVKCNAIAKSIFWVKDNEGVLPDVIGIAEVENRFVLERLLEDTPLYKADYKIVHYDSPDPRGIDVALLYRSSRLELLDAVPLRVDGGKHPPLRTRDILLTNSGSRTGTA